MLRNGLKIKKQSEKKENIPPEYLDYYTKQIMKDPYLARIDGQLHHVDKSTLGQLVDAAEPLPALKEQIDAWKKQKEEIQKATVPSIKKNDYDLNICVIGGEKSGKTALINQYVNHSFRPRHPSSSWYADFSQVTKELENGEVVNVRIWELPLRAENKGRDYHDQLQKLSQADAVIVVTDLTNMQDFPNMQKIVDQAEYYFRPEVSLLATTKSDLVGQQLVTIRTVNDYIKIKQIPAIIRTSAKDNTNVETLFDTAIETGVNNKLIAQNLIESMNGYKFKLDRFFKKIANNSDLVDTQKKHEFEEVKRKVAEIFSNNFNALNLDRLSAASKELQQSIQKLEDTAKEHRQNKNDHLLAWFFKANWARNARSYNDFKEVFNVHKQLKK